MVFPMTISTNMQSLPTKSILKSAARKSDEKPKSVRFSEEVQEKIFEIITPEPSPVVRKKKKRSIVIIIPSSPPPQPLNSDSSIDNQAGVVKSDMDKLIDAANQTFRYEFESPAE